MAARIELHRSRMVLAVALSLVMTACYAHDPARTASPVSPSGGDVVFQEELVASGASSLYDALVRTRRLFFVGRGPSSLYNEPTDAILVFRDGAIMGTVNVLTMMQATEVRAVRRISATETRHKYGRNVSVGGLEVELVNNR